MWKTWKDTDMTADESQKKRGDRWSKQQDRAILFLSLMDVSHLKNSELNSELELKSKMQNPSCIPKWHCERWFRLLRSITEQGSSVSQMTSANIMNVMLRLPGCAGQAADAVSAHTQVKMEDAPF